MKIQHVVRPIRFSTAKSGLKAAASLSADIGKQGLSGSGAN